MQNVVVIAELAAVVWAVVEMLKAVLPAAVNARALATGVAVLLGAALAYGLLSVTVVETVGQVVAAVLGASAAHNYLWKPGLSPSNGSDTTA